MRRVYTGCSAGGSTGGTGGGEAGVRSSLKDLLERLPEPFVMLDIEGRVREKTPYIVVALQEAGRMNSLLEEMRRSMEELQLGLDGALNMSDKMEALARGIATNTVRCAELVPNAACNGVVVQPP